MDRWSFNDFSSNTSRVNSRKSKVLAVEETSWSSPPTAAVVVVIPLLSSTGVGEVCLAAEIELESGREIYFPQTSFPPSRHFLKGFYQFLEAKT